MKLVEGGTQKMDGFWRGLKDSVARRGFKSGPRNSKTRARLYRLVREWQWRYWWLHLDRFQLFGKLGKEERQKKRAEKAAEAKKKATR